MMAFDPTQTKLYIQDVTLRDGMHAIRHQYGIEHAARSPARSTRPRCRRDRDRAWRRLAGQQLQLWLWRAHRLGVDRGGGGRAVKNAVVTTLLLPGIGTVHDLKQAYALGARSVRVATHCTEADVSKQHIEAARNLGMDTCRLPDDEPYDRAGAARSAGEADGKLRRDLRLCDRQRRRDGHGCRRARFEAYDRVLKPETQRGVHAHHNLSLASPTRSSRSRKGAIRVDASLAGHGRGRGQCAAGGFHRRCRPQGLEPRLRSLSS
jgi:4-hydroxy 2-oxovalerate aldolase